MYKDRLLVDYSIGHTKQPVVLAGGVQCVFELRSTR